MRALSFLFAGLLFAVGLALSGMTQPQKVSGFLDIFGQWDPALAFVMGGAVLVNLVFFRRTIKRAHPVFTQSFQLPSRRDLSPRLILGGVLFGAGWGLGGFCPGPAITSLATAATPALIFVGTMLVGMWLHHFYENRWPELQRPRDC